MIRNKFSSITRASLGLLPGWQGSAVLGNPWSDVALPGHADSGVADYRRPRPPRNTTGGWSKIARSILFLILIPLALIVRADDAADEKARSLEVDALAKKEAGAYSLARDGDDTKITLSAEPVFQWTNPVNGIVHGRLYLWTAGGRPEAVVGVYKWWRPFTHRTNEFQSLSTFPFVASRDGVAVWTPRRAGVEYKPIPDAPEPAATPAARLRQMRELAKEFTAKETTREDVVRDLRLLTQPLYRYEGTGPDLLDGALFLFAQGTDPEIHLLIEARKVEGKFRWHYAPARMNSITLRVSHKGKEVWSMPRVDQVDRREPYTSFLFDFKPASR